MKKTCETTYEIYIVLTGRCNFSCRHCLNSSGPKSNRYELTADEVDLLARTINFFPSIHTVHFSGGEATIKKSVIREIQNQVTRAEVNYALTSNGWFGAGRFDEFVTDLNISRLVLSYDKFHSPFIEKEKVLQLALKAKEDSILTTVNFVYESIQDLAEGATFTQAGIELTPSKVVKSGNYNYDNINDDLFFDEKIYVGTCPSLEGPPGHEKVIYIPGYGFTNCCGPLAFDRLGSNEFIFSKNFDQFLSTNPLRKCLSSKPLRAYLDSNRPDASGKPVRSKCELCCSVFSSQGSLGLYNQAMAVPEGAFMPFDGFLPSTTEAKVSQSRSIGYIFKGTATIFDGKEVLPEMRSVEVRALSSDELGKFLALYEKIYIRKFRNHISSEKVSDTLKLFNSYIETCSVRMGYFKNGVLIAALLLNPYRPHPNFDVDSVHIGFWGYDREAVSKSEANWIKAHWEEVIRNNLHTGNFVTATIFAFNKSSMGLMEKLFGGKAMGFRVEAK